MHGISFTVILGVGRKMGRALRNRREALHECAVDFHHQRADGSIGAVGRGHTIISTVDSA